MLKDFMDKKLEEIKTLFDAKNKQYGDVDELDNFRTGALMAYGDNADYPEMFEEAKAYQRKHIAFMETHQIDTPKLDESLMDIAVYSLIMLYMRERCLCETKKPEQFNIYYEKLKYQNLCKEQEEEIAIKENINKKQVLKITELQNENLKLRERNKKQTDTIRNLQDKLNEVKRHD